MLQSRIIIREPNGVQRMLPIAPQGLTIGRAPENGLVINYPTTSRYHAQITSDGINHYVTDLNSDNGTFLGDASLVANQPAVWEPGVPLHVGDVVLLLEQGQQQTASEQLEQQQPVKRDRQNTQTVAGWVPSFREEEKKSSGRIWLLVIGLIAALCVCSGLGVGGYFFFFS